MFNFNSYYIFVGFILVCMFVSMGYERHLKHEETKEAMKNGYIQKVDENNRVLWVKQAKVE